ncbi:MAG: exodeoxyribonuclease VII large subunit [Gemmatimonadales bacterium]
MRKRRQPAADDLFGTGGGAPDSEPRSEAAGALQDRTAANRVARSESSGRGAFAIAELVETLKERAESVGQVWIKGEITGLKVQGPGNWYFTLQDDQAQVRCVIWSTNARRIRTQPVEGAEVYLLGRPTVWAKRGELRVTGVSLLPTAGVGMQQLALEQARERLAQDGLLDPGRKRPLPPFPRTIAVVTSADGVVLHDILTVARRRWPAVRIVMVPARVQGDGAIDELVTALEQVNRLDAVDLCIVARGGGAREDLAVFNTEPVCRALAALTMPSISAVGHETDVTLTDLVADVRAATPSAAAAIALPDRAEVARHLSSLTSRLAAGLRRRTRVMAERVRRASERTEAGIRMQVLDRRRRFERLAASLDALSPLAVLGRGYSVARTAEGRVVRRRRQLKPGDPFTLRVSDGDLPARAE